MSAYLHMYVEWSQQILQVVCGDKLWQGHFGTILLITALFREYISGATHSHNAAIPLLYSLTVSLFLVVSG